MHYTYGAAGATDNRAGRIVLQEDASGAQEFFYGPLGEVIKNVRTIVIPRHDEQTYTTEWTYDTWNRLTSMTYADAKKLPTSTMPAACFAAWRVSRKAKTTTT